MERRNYCQSINNLTPTSDVWRMLKKSCSCRVASAGNLNTHCIDIFHVVSDK